MNDKEFEDAMIKEHKPRSSGKMTIAAVLLIAVMLGILGGGYWFLINGGAETVNYLLTPRIEIGGVMYDKDITEIVLNDAEVEDYGVLSQFKRLKKVDLRGQDISVKEYEEISAQLPGSEILWSVPIGSERIDCGSEKLTVDTKMPLSDLENIKYLSSLRELTNKDVPLTDELYEIVEPLLVSGSDCEFICTSSVSDVQLDNNTEELILSGIKLESTDELENVIRFFPHLKRIEMCDCGLSNDIMGGLREKYPEKTFVWTISFLRYTVRTDALVFSTLVDYEESHYGNQDTFADLFKYCTELRALDLGHHHITDISAITNLKKLQVLILADNWITDISPLTELPELNYIELFFNRFNDVTPLTKLEKLEDLNVCYCGKIKNPTELTNCKQLKRLYISHSNLKQSEIDTIQHALPHGCEFNWWCENAVNDGWRTNEKNAAIRKTFKYWKNVTAYESWDNVTIS